MAMVTKRIACFLTCGYTEAGAMQAFLKKINDNYEYRQYLPNKTIKKKGDSKTISPKISGLSGSALLEKVYTIIKNHTVEIAQCSGILIEDDLDGKFHDMATSNIESYINSIKENIYSIIGNPIPIFILYASPEIESWFIADWDNGFGYIYNSSGCVTDIENYGFFNQIYYKLSDQIIEAIQSDVKAYISALPNTNKLYSEQISSSRDLYYSKKLHGDRMLRNLDPSIIANKCRHFFFPVYNLLSNFN